MSTTRPPSKRSTEPTGSRPRRSCSFSRAGVPVAAEPPVEQECVEGYLFTRAPPSVLLLRRPPRRGRIWVPVSGKVEPGDASFAVALRRELEEETGITDLSAVVPLAWEVRFDGPNG